MSTNRERREAKAERLRGWAEGREAKAQAEYSRRDPYRGDVAFWTQPGRIVQRDRVIAAIDRSFEHQRKAESMARRAKGIERQLKESIYSDDPDAIERLEAKIAKMESQRDACKAENAAFRKEHRAELTKLTAYERDNAMPHREYVTKNLTANINRDRKRLEGLKRDRETPLAIVKGGRKGFYVKCPACQLPYMEGLTYDGAQQLANAHNAENHP